MAALTLEAQLCDWSLRSLNSNQSIHCWGQRSFSSSLMAQARKTGFLTMELRTNWASEGTSCFMTFWIAAGLRQQKGLNRLFDRLANPVSIRMSKKTSSVWWEMFFPQATWRADLPDEELLGTVSGLKPARRSAKNSLGFLLWIDAVSKLSRLSEKLVNLR